MPKSSNGWIQKREERFRARIIVDGNEYSDSFDTKAQAQRWLLQMVDRHRIGRLRRGLDPTHIKLGDALQRYSEEVSPTKKNKRREMGIIARLLREERQLCSIPLGHVLTADINDFIDRRLTMPSARVNRPVTGSTIRNELSVISHLYTVARSQWGYESVINPVVRGCRVAPSRARNRRLTRDEARRLLEAAREYESDPEATVKIGAIIGFATWTAMRRGEIASLDWLQVDMRVGVITLHETKNGTSRSVPLREEAYRLLEWLGVRESGSVFGTTGPAIGTAWHRVRARAGIEDLHFHDLRHEGTSRFFEDARKFNLTDTEIGSITGHKTWAMLQRYTHLRASDVAAKLRPGAFVPERPAMELFPFPALPAPERRDAESGRFQRAEIESSGEDGTS